MRDYYKFNLLRSTLHIGLNKTVKRRASFRVEEARKREWCLILFLLALNLWTFGIESLNFWHWNFLPLSNMFCYQPTAWILTKEIRNIIEVKTHIFRPSIKQCKVMIANITSESSKALVMWKIASQPLIWDKKAFPNPWPSLAPFTNPAISTTDKNAGT